MMMSKHGGESPHPIRRIIAGLSIVFLLVVLAVVGVLALAPGGGEQSTAIPVTALPVPTSETSHEHHIAAAHEISPGQAAFTAREQVNRDRQIAAGNPSVRETQSRIDQAMGGPVMFGPDTAMLTPYGETQVSRAVEVLRADPAAGVEVVGHPAVEINDPPLCLQLSRMRAEQVALRMEMAGIEPSRVSATGISHSDPRDTAGESRPVGGLAPAGWSFTIWPPAP